MSSLNLYLMNRKGWSVLKTVLAKYGRQGITAIITSRDPAMVADYYDEIKQVCVENKVPVYDRSDKNIPAASYKIAIGWRWIIQDEQGLIVLHDSLLPRYRGFAPLVNALINGEKEAGVTALFACNDYDRGDIIGQLSTTLDYPVKIATAIEQVSSLYETLVLDIISVLNSGNTPVSRRQNEKDATYSLWRDEDDYRIDWHKPAAWIKRFIDAVGFPYKGAKCLMEQEEIRITDSEELPDVMIENRDPGKVIFMQDGKPVIVCGQGLIKLTEITSGSGKSLIPFPKFRVRLH